MLTEIEIDGIGTYRLPNVWQHRRIRRVKPSDRHAAALAFGLGMSVAQFRKLPAEKKDEVHRAYWRLVGPPGTTCAA